MYQQLWGYKVGEKLYLGVREQKRLNTTALYHLHNIGAVLHKRSRSHEKVYRTSHKSGTMGNIAVLQNVGNMPTDFCNWLQPPHGKVTSMWDFKFSRRRVWCSELSSGLYCRLKRRSTIILHGSTTQKTALNITSMCLSLLFATTHNYDKETYSVYLVPDLWDSLYFLH
jgi:hypothetical protein